jgi:membrane-associated protein
MHIIAYLIDFILHIDIHLGSIISQYGFLTYGLLFLIIFIETGLVVTPFLPGDSLLFAAGAFASLGSFNILALLLILTLAAVSGDTANYWIGHFFGEELISHPKVPIKKEHIKKTQEFFAKYGGKTIVLARFIPIIRTFAPFVAGVGKMHYGKFISFNVVGGVAWVLLFSLAGYFFGNIPSVKHNFSLVVIAIVLLSVTPMIYGTVKTKRDK